MPAFPSGSQRRGPGPAGLAAIAPLFALLVVGCSLLAPATFLPAQSIAAATDAPATAALTASPTATQPGATSEASSEPRATPPPPPPQWRAVTRSLDAPAAWLDFGFAANGDLLAIGSEDAGADPLHLFVARYGPNGRRKEQHDLGRSVTPIPGDWAAIDPTDDSILLDDYDLPTGLFTLRSFSSGSGFEIAAVRSELGINRVAIDARGRVYGLPQYGVDGNPWAAIVRLDARGEVRIGVDYWLRPLDAGPRPDGPGILAYPTAIAVGRDGRVLVVDAPDIETTFPDGTPRLQAVVTSLGPNLGAPLQWEVPAEWKFGSAAFGSWAHNLAVAGGLDGVIYLGEPVPDATGTTIASWRVRRFDRDGAQLATWGDDDSSTGVLRPTHPAVDAAGRLWVIDTDGAGRSFVAVLSLPA